MLPKRRRLDVEVLVPMKSMPASKSRLAPVLESPRRQALTLWMLKRVLWAVTAALGPGAVHVLGGDGPVGQTAVDSGVRWSEDPGKDLNSSLWLAMRDAYHRGVSATLFLPGDLPLLTSEDVRALVRASGEMERPVGVAARRDGGTNALLLPKAIAVVPALGGQSFRRHQTLVGETGAVLEELRLPNIAFDLDLPEDLYWLQSQDPGLGAEVSVEERRLADRDALSLAGGRSRDEIYDRR